MTRIRLVRASFEDTEELGKVKIPILSASPKAGLLAQNGRRVGQPWVVFNSIHIILRFSVKKFVLIIALSCVSPGFGQSGPISSSNFGFQCGTGNTLNCKNPSPPPQGVWPTGATPGLLRLHDAGTTWSGLNPSSGTFTWNNLDQWLDMIAAHQP